MGKVIHLLAIAALVYLQVIVTEASSSSSEEEESCDKKCKKPNEVYDKCPTNCPARTCGIDDRLVKCAAPPKPCDPSCKPACRCKDGYYRDNKGNCVVWKKCPKCPKYEVYDPCDVSCPARTCDFDPTVAKCAPPPELGDPRCIARCRCIDGYLRNSKGVCVPKDECDNCKKNEKFDKCPATNCLIKECSDLGFPIKCKEKRSDGSCPGKPGCLCADGYARDCNGVCIKIEDCPSCGGDKNAQSGCGGNCGKKCSDVGKKGPFNCPIGCSYNGCDCRDGFYYDDKKKKCVKPSECPPLCKKNERFVDCPEAVCEPKKCTEVGFPVACPDLSNCDCPSKPGCICISGYVRNSKGVCVPKKKCPSCGGDKNAEPGCGTNCGKKCSDVGKKGPFKCPKICNKNGCDCKDGYYYDDKKKKCVKPCDCTPICKNNERFVDCPEAVCEPKKCTEVGFPVACPDLSNCDCPSKPGCICISGYVRNSKGVCVPKKKCPSCGGDKNAEPGCGTNCGKKCSDVGKKGPFKCPKICNKNGCDCKDGYYYDDKKKKCVKPCDCTPICKKNERFVDCPEAVCEPKKCTEVGFPVACPDLSNCDCPSKPGCICISGYVRNSKGVCVPKKKCPSCGGDKNAEPGCGTNCGKKCSDVGKKGPFKCPKICNKNACDCKDGYYYDDKKKKCVKPCDCTPICKKNERFVDCPEAVCEPKKCSEVGFPLSCTDLSKCDCPSKPGCICKSGYVRNSKGVCIPAEKCQTEPQTCKENEVLVECPENNCNAQSCSQLGFEVACTDQFCSGIFRCICKDGYLKDSNGVCIPSGQCPSCGGDENAKAGCGGNCGRKCSDIGRTGPIACPLICRINGCDCKEGFYFDEKKNKCVLPSQCTNTPTCRANEVYSSCANGGCRRRTCSDIDRPILCIDPRTCKPGCICADGFYKNSKGNCVSEKQCRSESGCKGDINAVPGCGVNCRKKCSDVGRTGPFICPKICMVGGCDCKDGYYYDEIKKKCVLPNKCTNKCTRPNEEYNVCPPNCPPGVCGIDDRLIDCAPQPQPGDPNCNKPACRCKSGFYRDDKGNCVVFDKCPVCKKPNEIYDPCDASCPERTCSFDPTVVRCAAPPQIGDPNCVVGCRCEDGYLRNDNGDCVPKEECNSCKKNEKYEKCPATYCLIKKCTDLGFPLKCIDKPSDGSCPGKPGCVCEPGYARNSKGICIPIKQCPSCGGDKNARSGCGSNCGRKCSDVGKKGPFKCPPSCRYNGCDCKDGFYYNPNTKKCVRAKECPPTCKANERFVDCPDALCEPQNCNQVGFPVACPSFTSCPSKPGCVCISGYVRNSKRVCIPTSECPTCGGDKNAKPGCGSNCGKQCSDVGKTGPFTCPVGCSFNGCDCKDGFYYDQNKNKCVPPEQCPGTCKVNERFVECPEGVCEPKTCDQVGFPIACPDVTSCPSKPGCICASQYVKNSKGVCIPTSECPTCGGDKNAKPGCGSNCGKQCSDVGKTGPFTCPVGCSLNGCDCKDGFYYDQNKNKCVLPEHCPDAPCDDDYY